MLNKSVTVFILVSFLFPTICFAKWDDKSDELPGTVDTGTIVAIAVVGVVAIGVLAYVVKKKKSFAESRASEEGHPIVTPTLKWTPHSAAWNGGNTSSDSSVHFGVKVDF